MARRYVSNTRTEDSVALSRLKMLPSDATDTEVTMYRKNRCRLAVVAVAGRPTVVAAAADGGGGDDEDDDDADNDVLSLYDAAYVGRSHTSVTSSQHIGLKDG